MYIKLLLFCFLPWKNNLTTTFVTLSIWKAINKTIHHAQTPYSSHIMATDMTNVYISKQVETKMHSYNVLGYECIEIIAVQIIAVQTSSILKQ